MTEADIKHFRRIAREIRPIEGEMLTACLEEIERLKFAEHVFETSTKAIYQDRDRLKAEVGRLRAALKPFAEYAGQFDGTRVPDDIQIGHYSFAGKLPTIGDCRRASEVLK